MGDSRLDDGDGVSVLRLCEFLRKFRNDIESALHVLLRSLPGDCTTSSRVVEPVLRSRSSVNVDVDLESVFPRPSDRFEQIRPLTIDVRFSLLTFERPVSNRDTNGVPIRREGSERRTKRERIGFQAHNP